MHSHSGGDLIHNLETGPHHDPQTASAAVGGLDCRHSWCRSKVAEGSQASRAFLATAPEEAVSPAPVLLALRAAAGAGAPPAGFLAAGGVGPAAGFRSLSEARAAVAAAAGAGAAEAEARPPLPVALWTASPTEAGFLPPAGAALPDRMSLCGRRGV